MRECPKCHYIDPPNWRHPPHFPDVDYVRYDEFLELHPDLAKGLKPGGTVEDELHVYRLSRTSRYVYRMWKPIYKAMGGDKSWSQARRTKMYDAEGRLDKAQYRRLLRVMAELSRLRKERPLDRFVYPPDTSR